MFTFAPEIRKAIYTTNTIESLNMTLRKIIKNRAMFPSDEAVFKILYLAWRNISKRWTMPIANWSGAMKQFAILFGNRLPESGFNDSPSFEGSSEGPIKCEIIPFPRNFSFEFLLISIVFYRTHYCIKT
jgi:hypothetical protein